MYLVNEWWLKTIKKNNLVKGGYNDYNKYLSRINFTFTPVWIEYNGRKDGKELNSFVILLLYA